MTEPLQRVPVAPGNHTEPYAPIALRTNAEAALDRLFEMELDDARRAILHTVDPILLEELSNALLGVAFLSNTVADRAADLRELLVQQRLITTKRRADLLVEPRSARAIGEEAQLKAEEIPEVVKRMTDRERERRYHARRLWDLCAVRYQVEFFASPNPADQAELQLQTVLARRGALRYFDDHFPLREGPLEFKGLVLEGHGFDDVPVVLGATGRKLASEGGFATSNEGRPIALSCIQEIRFLGHGSAGGDGVPATFKFSDSETTAQDLLEVQRNLRFQVVRTVIAPGASILVEGCETGRGPAGKTFLAALARLCFGDSKWGFVRASTESITVGVIPAEGPIPVRPVTLKWPDDF